MKKHVSFTELKKTFKDAVDALDNVQTAEEGDLEYIAESVRKNSTCVLIDLDNFGNPRLYAGKIGSSVETVDSDRVNIKSSPKQFIKDSIQNARDCETEREFVGDARRLARMLEMAARRIERELRQSKS